MSVQNPCRWCSLRVTNGLLGVPSPSFRYEDMLTFPTVTCQNVLHEKRLFYVHSHYFFVLYANYFMLSLHANFVQGRTNVKTAVERCRQKRDFKSVVSNWSSKGPCGCRFSFQPSVFLLQNLQPHGPLLDQFDTTGLNHSISSFSTVG